MATDCPTINAVARPSVTEHDVSKFLEQLWLANYNGGPDGTYQLQRCENPGSAPFHVQCVLFSTGTPLDLAALRNLFTASRLFSSVTADG